MTSKTDKMKMSAKAGAKKMSPMEKMKMAKEAKAKGKKY